MATAEPLAASLSKAARDFESLLRSSECRPVEEFLEAPKLGASIPLMAELFKRAGVKSREELESTVKAQFRDAKVGNIILGIIFTHCRYGIPGRNCLTWKPIGMPSWQRWPF